MKRLIALAIMAAPLAACTQGNVQSVSAAVVISADQAYAAYVNSLVSKVQAGTLSREDFHSKESVAYASLLLVRSGQLTALNFQSGLKE